MKVALCCIGRMENKYAVEYVENYKQLGFDKIFIYDNNYDGEEHFEDVLQSYIDDGFVEIINYRNRAYCQLQAYQECYDNHGKEYDWIAFFDFDEYLTLNFYHGIKHFLSSDIFELFDMIHVNWKIYGDSNLVEEDDKPLLEKFTEPVKPIFFKKTFDFPENCHAKSIIRGGLEVDWANTPHTPSNFLWCCTTRGVNCDPQSPFVITCDFDNCYIKHFVTKTIDEFYNNKVKRGYPDGNKDFFKDNDWIKDFFKYNIVTKEKIEWLKNNGFNTDEIINK